ncbi:MAG: hypothetical protein HY313_03125 [Acidobacteria bacterium]|nr:hypothetical protein [Acidobacteriota bacterium]
MATVTPPTIRRSSERIPMAIPIVLWGVDSGGKSFIEKTQTVMVNRRGAKALTKHTLILGAQVKVAIPHLKRASSAKVAWSGGNQGEYREVGIDLGHVEDFWSLPFSEDSLAFRATFTETEPNGNSAATKSWEASGQELDQLITASDASAPQSSTTSEAHMDSSEKLVIALRALTRSAIEHSQSEVLQKLNRQAEEILDNLQRTMIEETQEHLRRTACALSAEFETRLMEAVAHHQQVCEQTLAGLAKKTQEGLEASLAKYQERLTASAQTARRELARTLAHVSGTLGEV